MDVQSGASSQVRNATTTNTANLNSLSEGGKMSPFSNLVNNNNDSKLLSRHAEPQRSSMGSSKQTPGSLYSNQGLSFNRSSSHSYYDCCINVHVTSLLDHWLDWEPTPSRSDPACCQNNRSQCYLQSNTQRQHCHHFSSSGGDTSSGEDSSDESTSSADMSYVMSSSPSSSLPCDDQTSQSNGDLEWLMTRLREEYVNNKDPLVLLKKLSRSLQTRCDDADMKPIQHLRDIDGNCLLHHLLSGHEPFSSLSAMLECGHYLLNDLKADPNEVNDMGETALLAIRHLLDQSRWDDAVAAINLLLTSSEHQPDLNVRDSYTDQSLLSFAVVHGDKALAVTRFLINSGAKVFNAPTTHSVARRLDGSAFRSWLKSITTGMLDFDSSRETFDVLCNTMSCEDESNRMSKHVDRCMIELGVAPKVNGPLFLMIRSLMAPFMARPQTLMNLARIKIRKAVRQQPKRLNTTRPVQLRPISATTDGTRQLHLPQKLKQFISMGE